MNLWKVIIIKFNEGGPFLTYPILLLLLVIVALFVKALLKEKDFSKTISLIKSLSWFTIAWGFLGRTFGLIDAFDNVEAAGELTPSLLAEGLKMALLNPLFAIVVFLIARVGIIALIIMQKKKLED
ncbi:MAG: MotA/TolQ/ExbB proton channel family protein [Bacteroidales bacterium]|nr:MotA/TolQ/ExbB proton channel family protein [Bacteroidales bacterium]